MSEALPGLPEALAPAPPRDAAVVLLLRQTADGPELFWIRRSAALRFAAGFFAFPGGRVDASDAALTVSGACGPDATLIAAAARELFEETGVLVSAPPVACDPGTLADHRRALLDGKMGFADVLSALSVGLDASDFRPAGRWITPPFLPTRYDARFYLVDMPEGQRAGVVAGELTEGGWIAPRDGLVRWEDGSALLHPPNLHALRVLSERTSVEEALARLANPPHVKDLFAERIEFQKGVRLLPLRAPTLPPATHTNCYILGDEELLIVDPGSPDPEEQEKLEASISGLCAEGRRVKAVFLTHHHSDHIGGARVARERLGAPLWAHAKTANRVSGVDRLIADGEVISLCGTPRLELAAVHTPGHAKGHLCLYDPKSRALFCGDMLAGVGTVIIDPPEGDLGDYLASLERLKALPCGVLYPSHGPALVDGLAKIDETLAHRQMRVAQILAALSGGARTLRAIVEEVYSDLPTLLHPLAERSALASLDFLERQGQIARDGDAYRRGSGTLG